VGISLLIVLALIWTVLKRKAQIDRINADLMREAEERKASEAELAHAQEIAHVGSWTWDAQTKAVRWSDKQFRIFGYEPGAVEPSLAALRTVLHPDDRAACIEFFRKATRTGEMFEYEFRVTRPSGEVRHVYARGQGLLDEAGRLVAVHGTTMDITERTQAGDLLAASERHFRQIYEYMPVGIVVVECEGRTIVEVNSMAADLIGAPREEILGKVCHKFICSAETGQCPVCDLNQTVDYSEQTLLAFDGTEIPVLKTVVKVNLAGRDCQIEAFTDIRARKEAEKALYLERMRSESLALLDNLSSVDISDLCDYALQKSLDITASPLGYFYFYDEDAEVFTIHAWSESVIAECKTFEKQAHYELGKAGLWGESVRQRKPIITNDYTAPNPWKKGCPESHVQLRRYMTVPIFDKDRIVAMVGVANKHAPYDEADASNLSLLVNGIWRVIARREAEKEILRLNEDLERKVKERTGELRQTLNDVQSARDRIDGILKSVADGIIVTDIYNNVVLMNRAAEDLLDVRLSEILGQPIDFVIKAATLREKLMKSIRQNKTSYKFDFMLPDREDRHMNAQTSVIFDKDGRYTGLVTVIRDVTYEREVDRMKTEFISTAAHELRTPLTSIRGFSEILLTRGGLTEAERAEFLSYINKQSLNLAAIINDLLDISRIEAKKGLAFNKVDFKPCESLGNIMSYYQKSSPGHTFELAMPEEDVMIHADPAKLQQVMENLLGNAVKYSPEGGTIRIQASRKGDDLHVCVRDEGIGMTAEQVGRVFEKFYRADTSNLAVEGTGLGMTIVKYIVEAHGGSIHVESELGTGTAVHFLIPLTDASGKGKATK
jgi:PAS domain S-box-containing protein